MDIEKLLIELGYDVGTADGILGKKTQAALKEFQSHIGQEETGIPRAYMIKQLSNAIEKTRAETQRLVRDFQIRIAEKV